MCGGIQTYRGASKHMGHMNVWGCTDTPKSNNPMPASKVGTSIVWV